MIKKHYAGAARRARNVLWNAAGRYDFDPPFLAFFPNGEADNYFNMVVGFADKWLDLERLWDFFLRYEHDRRAGEFDEFLWLGIENCVYEKELPERPLLAKLRRERAEAFFAMQQKLSRQQMEYQSAPVYTQQQARWAAVSGRHAPLMTPREKRMSEALRFPGKLDTDGVIAAMESFLRDFFRYAPGPEGPAQRVPGAGRRFFRHERKRRDRLLVRAGTGEGNHPRAVQQKHAGLGRHVGPTEEDAAYIRAVFGPCAISDRELQILENELCVGNDAACRLWITRAEAARGGADPSGLREAAELREAVRRQQKRNEAYLRAQGAMIQNSVRKLSTQIETLLRSWQKHLPEPARRGRLRPEAAYRLPVLGDARVFQKEGDETEPEICFDLLLDASQSRMHSQEILSGEAYILAKSLEKLHIPVRVSAFRSVRGYLVLEVLKRWEDSACEGLTWYYAGGWNRDGLALRTLGRLDDDEAVRGKKRFLLVLTDASPNDSTPLPSNGLLTREYEGAAAVKDAEDAVRALRRAGIRTGAVFHGNTSHMENLNQIYGHEYVRIRTPAQLAQGVGDLLLMMLRETRPEG